MISLDLGCNLIKGLWRIRHPESETRGFDDGVDRALPLLARAGADDTTVWAGSHAWKSSPCPYEAAVVEDNSSIAEGTSSEVSYLVRL